MNYLYRKGRIVTITWKHGGDICKVLARPGQFVFDTITKDIYLLQEGEYIVEEIRMIGTFSDYLVPQMNTKPTPGRLVNDIHLVPSAVYEKKLRRLGIDKSPLYNQEEPEGITGEIIAFKTLLYPYKRPRLVKILKANGSPAIPLFTLSNGETIERGTLKLFYRRTIPHEQHYYNNKKRDSLISIETTNQKVSASRQICLTT